MLDPLAVALTLHNRDGSRALGVEQHKQALCCHETGLKLRRDELVRKRDAGAGRCAGARGACLSTGKRCRWP